MAKGNQLSLVGLAARIDSQEKSLGDILAAIQALNLSPAQQQSAAAAVVANQPEPEQPEEPKSELDLLREEMAILNRRLHEREQIAKENFAKQQPPAVRRSQDEQVHDALSQRSAVHSVVVAKGNQAGSDFGRDAYSRKVTVKETGRDGIERETDKNLFLKDGNRQRAYDQLISRLPAIHLVPTDPRTGEVVGNAIELKLKSSSWQPDADTIGNVMYAGQRAETLVAVDGNIYAIAAASGDCYFTLKRREK